MLSKALVEVPIKAKVECVRTQKNSQAYKKKLRARNRTSFVDLKKRFSSSSYPAQLVLCLLFWLISWEDAIFTRSRLVWTKHLHIIKSLTNFVSKLSKFRTLFAEVVLVHYKQWAHYQLYNCNVFDLSCPFGKGCNTCSNSWRNTTQLQTPHPHAKEA